jgi:hypothetical protein
MKKYFVCVLFLFCGAVFAQNDIDMQTVATVKLTKTEPITVKQLKNEVESIESATDRKLSGSERREVLDGMINQRLAIQAADRDKINVTDSEVNQQIEELKNRLAQTLGRKPTDAEFSKAIREQAGLDLPAFRDQIRKNLIVQKYLFEKKRDLIQSVKTPTDAEIENEYNLQKASLTQDETLQFSAIVFSYDKDSDKAKARADAEKLEKEIGGTVNAFDEKLNQPSNIYKATTSGILLRNAKARSDVGQEFLDAVFALKYDPKSGATEVSKVLEVPQGSAKGFYIIKINAKYPFKSPLGLDDTMIGYNAKVRTIIGTGLMQQKQQQILVKAQEELVSELRRGNPFTINDQYLNF